MGIIHKKSAQLKLTPNINVNLKVVEIRIFTLIWYNMERRRVGNKKPHNLNISSVINLNELRSMS